MRTGPKLKGKAVAATQGKTRNQPETLRPELRSKAVAPTQGRTRNHPSVAPVPKEKIGVGVAHTYFGNSRDAVHHKFSVKGKHD